MTDANRPVRIHADQIAAVSAAIGAAPVVALDTEFHTEGRYLPDLFLVQLHVPDVGTWIVDPLDGDLLARLGPALLSGCAWLVHAGSQDLRLMQHAIGGVAEVVHDTQVASGIVTEVYPDALDRLVARWLGQPLPKAAQLSDWSVRPLTEAQLTYAARDVICLPALWQAILDAAAERGRVDAVHQACAWARDDALSTNPEAIFQRLVRGTSLSGERAAVLYALVAWRDEKARARNRPAAFVLGDAVLKQLAKAMPTSVGEIAGNRRIKASLVERYGNAILEAVERGRTMPEEARPPVAPRGSVWADRVAWLQLAARTFGRTHQVAARLALPDALTLRFAIDGPVSREAVRNRLGPWRDSLIGDMVYASLQGQLSLRLDDSGVREDPIPPNSGKSEAT